MRRTVKPARKGLKIRNPDAPGAYLPEDGVEVNWSSFWNRRVQEGDVEVVSESGETAADAQEAPARKKGSAASKGTTTTQKGD